MMVVKFKRFMFRAIWAGCLCVALAGIATAQVVTVSFQNGVNGYTGTFDRMISERNDHNQDGSEVATDFLDGYKTDTSPDEQALLRFDDIFGDGWMIHTNGSTTLEARPRLVVFSADLGP